MRIVDPPPVRLGPGHCCLCATTCNHVGPIQTCQAHAADVRAAVRPVGYNRGHERT